MTSPSAPPYRPTTTVHTTQPRVVCPNRQGMHRSQPSLATLPVYYHPRVGGVGVGADNFDVDSSVPNSPQPVLGHVNKPMMVPGDAAHCLQITPNGNDNNNTENNVNNNQTTDNNKNRRLYRKCTLMSVGLLSAALLAVLVGFGVWYARTEKQPISQVRHTNCISCAVLMNGMDVSGGRMRVNVDDIELAESEDGKTLCCLKASAKTDNILEMLLEQARRSGPSITKAQVQNRTREHPTTVKEVETRIHHRNQAAALVGLERPPPPTINDSVRYVLKEWGSDSSPALYIRPEIIYNENNGHFTVPRDGLYNVNIHISLANNGERTKSFQQELMRFNRHSPATGDQKLASDRENIPASERRTSSLALTVHLQQNDELFLRVRPASVVVDKSSMSFFCVVFESS